MLQIALGLERAGVPMEEAKIAHEILRKQLSRAADDLVQYFVRRAQDAEGPEQVTRSLLALRSAGVDAPLRLVFAQEVERSLREANRRGPRATAEPPQEAALTSAAYEVAGRQGRALLAAAVAAAGVGCVGAERRGAGG